MNEVKQSIAVPTTRRFRISTDCYIQKFIKYPLTAECHSYAELLHLALLEFDPSVSSFTPQPKRLKINGQRYIPDCLFIQNGEKHYVELKPRGEFKESLRRPLEEYARRKNCKFEVVANETIFEQEVRAKNSLSLLRVLLSAVDEDTAQAEEDMLGLLFSNRSMPISALVDKNERLRNRHSEIALYRLFHNGAVSIDMNDGPIRYQTRVRYLEQSSRPAQLVNLRKEMHHAI